ncbi:MAG: gamma-glutamylcyclotransferase, partial [Bacteroidota bacterium]|nr:gamma-glutamylcyclotransferase [Bacteroidota bacterium]
SGDKIKGSVFAITGEELMQADKYEVDDYKRIAVTLESGKVAWVYVSRDTQTPIDDLINNKH